MKNFEVWNLADDRQRYNKCLEKCNPRTVFHLTEYLLAEAEAENGITVVFYYEEDGMFALIPEVLRRINDLPYMVELEEELYDMITPHEYSGIISNSYDNALKNKLLKNILSYCRKNNIICQFIRLNPYLAELPLIYKENGFDVFHSNEQVYVNLEQTEENIMKQYRSNVRRNIKRAKREGLTFEIAEKNLFNVNAFQGMYRKSMYLLGARNFFYFNNRYFNKLIECDCSKLAFVKEETGKIIAASIMLLDRNTAYYHLGCSDREYALKRPMNYLMHSMILWSRRMGKQIFHLGGGHKSLMQFKEAYSETRIDYYVASQICDQKKYLNVCKKWKEQFSEIEDENYYPLYRYNE